MKTTLDEWISNVLGRKIITFGFNRVIPVRTVKGHKVIILKKRYSRNGKLQLLLACFNSYRTSNSTQVWINEDNTSDSKSITHNYLLDWENYEQGTR